MSEPDKCPFCETEYIGEYDLEGNLYCACDGATISYLQKKVEELSRLFELLVNTGLPGMPSYQADPTMAVAITIDCVKNLQAENAALRDWVSVSERLPEKSFLYPWGTVDVQIWDGNDIMSPAFYYLEDLPKFGWKQGVWRWADKVIPFVTHWRPLPELPGGRND